MKNFVASIAVLILLITSAAPHASQRPDPITPPSVPTGLEVVGGFKPFLMGHAVGTQNYICASTADGIKWLFIGPQATVFNDDSQQIITHFQSNNPLLAINAIQATWQHSHDSSAVWAKKVRGSSDSNYVASDAIEWLLLEASGAEMGPTGGNKLTGTRYIQRVNTVGGKEPATGCSASTLNTRALVPYQADYFFYR